MQDSTSRQIDFLRVQVPFLRGAEVVHDRRGHSRVACFVVTKNGKKFFAKLYPRNREQDLIRIEQTYQKLGIPTAKIVDLKYLSATDKTFCIYEFIEGETFAEMMAQLSLAEIKQLGEKVGREAKKFQRLRGNRETYQQELDREIDNLLKTFHQQKENYEKTLNQKLPEINLPRFEKSLHSLLKRAQTIPPNFVHTDINLTNIIIRNGTPVFVDTDGSKISFRALDFRGNVWWCWNQEMQAAEIAQERAAYQGIYQGIFDGQIPESFHSELSFTMLYEFLIRVKKYAGDLEQTYYSFMRWKENLEQTNYFENYQFPWF